MAIVDNGMQLVVVHDGRGEDCHGDAHVSIVSRLHGGSKVEIFEITHHAAGAGGGNDAIEKQFGSDEVSSFSADIASVFNTVAMWDSFFRSVGTDDAEVGGMAVFGNGQDWNEKHGAGSCDHSCTLCQVVNLGGIGLLPKFAIGTGAEFFVFS